MVGTQIKDLSPLLGMTKLEYLDIQITPVQNISPLVGFRSLRYLYVSTTITEAQVDALRQALPSCYISRN